MEPTIINIGKVDNTTQLQNSALLKMKLLGMLSNPDYSQQGVKNAELQAVVEEFSLREIADNALPTTPALKYGAQSRDVFMEARVSDNVKVFIPVTSGGNPWVADAVETTEGDDIVTFRPDYTVLASETKELIGIINPGEQHEVVIDSMSENPTFTLSNRYNDLLVEGIETVKIPQNEYDQICSPVDVTEY